MKSKRRVCILFLVIKCASISKEAQIAVSYFVQKLNLPRPNQFINQLIKESVLK